MATVAPSRPTRKAPSTAAGRLTAAEREIVLTLADDEDAWVVYTDSRRALAAALLRAARRWGREPVRVGGHGWEVRLPLAAVRFGGPRRPLTEAQRRQRRLAAAASQKARNGPRTNERPLVSEGPPARADAETVPAAARRHTPSESEPLQKARAVLQQALPVEAATGSRPAGGI